MHSGRDEIGQGPILPNLDRRSEVVDVLPDGSRGEEERLLEPQQGGADERDRNLRSLQPAELVVVVVALMIVVVFMVIVVIMVMVTVVVMVVIIMMVVTVTVMRVPVIPA